MEKLENQVGKLYGAQRLHMICGGAATMTGGHRMMSDLAAKVFTFTKKSHITPSQAFVFWPESEPKHKFPPSCTPRVDACSHNINQLSALRLGINTAI